MIAGNMEEIINTSIAMDITKEEPCNKVFEADICGSIMFHDGHGETYNSEKMTDSIDEANAESQDAGISEEKKIIPSEILGNLSEVEVKEIPEMDKIVQPVNTENVPSIENKEVPKKASNSISNKRKSDNHIESNIEEKKALNMRKNIRGVINETNFDTITITAQREESERLARVQLLKKTLRQNRIQSALESLAELNSIDVDLPIEKCVVTCETPEISQQHRKIHFDSKEMKMQRISEKVVEKKMWSQYLTSHRTNMQADEKDEVVTIDSSSEDDCIILSDSDDCADEDPDDDHHNSGLHVRDVLNIPNEHGKVMVNVGHVESEPDIFVAPQIAKIIKPHQIGGVRFLFDNIIESTKMFNTSSGFGCILAHSMGLGKTLQVVTFSDIFLRHTNSKTILCVMPINTIQNWVKEFNLWVPKESNNPEEVRPRTFSVFALNDQHKTMNSRSNVIMRWAAEGGVLLIGYELFRVLALKIVKKKDGKKHENGEHKRMLDNIHMALVKPGPDLVICDEGHRIKNAHAGISIALKQIRTRRRIVLTGYPLQNNLLEYWCMVDFVRPNYLGSKTEFCNMFERPIQNGQCIDSTPGDIKLMRYRAHVLHSLLVGFVQRRSDAVLQNSLPQKLEYVILTKMTKFQRELYEAFMNEVVRKKKVPNPLKAFAVCCKIWNHPDVLYKFLKKRESDLDLDIDEQDAALKSNTESAKFNKKNDFTAAKTNDESIGKTSIDTTLIPGKPNEFNTYLNEEGLSREYMNAPDNNLPAESFYTNTFDQKGFEQRAMMNPSKEGQNTFWQDGVTALNAQPLKPDYISRMAPTASNGIIEEKSKCSSEIVDLDTKEVQFIKSDISADLFSGKIPNAGNIKPNKPETDPVLFNPNIKTGKTEPKAGNECISYDWALNLIKNYEPGIVSSSPKMQVFLYILEESIKLGDRVLVFSQSLLTLNLMEFFLENLVIPESQNNWKKNVSYFRLDGSTTSLEREKLVNEFNSNTDVKLFLISTRAGSLGINLTGANRVVVFDASWNPCHDTQAVHRIYRYGQRKSCFVYRIVMDNCLEKNIYDRQVKKQGMSDRVVDECNPDAHLSIRELTNLCYDKEEENQSVEFTQPLENYTDVVMRKVITNHKSILSKEPFYHESLLIDRKEKKLSQTEKKLAKRGYEIEKKASTKPTTFLPNNIDYKVMPHRDGISNHVMSHQVHSIRKKPAIPFKSSAIRLTRWIPAEVWQRQGMSSQEMKLPIDVAIPTNSTETSNIVVKAGEKVMVLNSPKGVYMQLESGKIIAIKTSAEAALQRGKLRAKKLNCGEIPEKKPIAMEPIAFKKDDRCRARVERPLPDVDNDDVIVINDSINDSPETSFDMSYPNNKTRTEPISMKNDNLPQVFRKKNEIVATETRTDKQEILTPQTHQEFQPHTIAESLSPRNNYVGKPRNNLFGNILNNSNYEIPPPPHSIENQQHLPAVSNNRWENKSPDIFKQSLKISNIPAPYPSVSALGIFEKNEKAQQPVNDVINVDQQYPPPPYTQTCKTSEEHIYNPSMNLNTNYYNNTLPTTTPTDDNGSMNMLYQYNNKNESNYSENLYENSDPSFSNYHQQMSKYSYGYYQPQYLPNFNNKVYDNNAYSSASSQYYLRRPTTYPTSSTNGVDVGLNYAEPQGWIKKQHLPD